MCMTEEVTNVDTTKINKRKNNKKYTSMNEGSMNEDEGSMNEDDEESINVDTTNIDIIKINKRKYNKRSYNKQKYNKYLNLKRSIIYYLKNKYHYKPLNSNLNNDERLSIIKYNSLISQLNDLYFQYEESLFTDLFQNNIDMG